MEPSPPLPPNETPHSQSRCFTLVGVAELLGDLTIFLGALRVLGLGSWGEGGPLGSVWHIINHPSLAARPVFGWEAPFFFPWFAIPIDWLLVVLPGIIILLLLFLLVLPPFIFPFFFFGLLFFFSLEKKYHTRFLPSTYILICLNWHHLGLSFPFACRPAWPLQNLAPKIVYHCYLLLD